MKALLPLLLVVVSGLSMAGDQDAVRRAVAEGRLRPLAEIIDTVQARYPGRIVDVELEQRRGTYVYEIEILMPDRSKVEVKVDGASGVILDSERPAAQRYQPVPALLREVQARFGGHPIDVELENGVYQVELALDGGRRLHLAIDPVTGEMVENSTQDTQLGAMQPMAEVIEALLGQYPGTLLEAELERTAAGRYYYEVEIEDAAGREHSLHVDAFSGEILREDED